MLNRPSKAVVTRVVGIVGALVALSAFLVLSNVPGSVFGQETGVIMYAENGTAPVLTFTSEDPEGMGIHWDVTGVDADDFSISGGVLTFNDPPDYEKPSDRTRADDTETVVGEDNMYQITIRASEMRPSGSTDRALSTETHVTVEVTDKNEGGMVTFNLIQPEVGTPIMATLEDPDGTPTLTGTDLGWDWYVSKVTNPIADAPNHWALATGSVDGADTATTTYTPAGDRVTEADDAAVDEGKFLRAVATYSDALGGPRMAIMVSYNPVRAEVSVLGDTGITIPDNGSPGFTEGLDYTRTIPENTARGMNVGTPVTAEDPNSDTLTYELDNNLTAGDVVGADSDATLFSIDKATGQIKVNGTLDFDAEGTLQPPNPKEYKFYVRAIDPSDEYAEVEVTVIVTNANDPPMIMGSATPGTAVPEAPSELRVNEHDSDDRDDPPDGADVDFTGAPDMMVTHMLGNMNVFTASDEDTRGQIFWSLKGEDADDFVRSQQGLTGESDEPIAIRFKNAPDYEMPTDANGDNVYKVTLVARDSAGAEDERPLTIFVDNVEEQGKATLTAEGDDPDQPVIDEDITAMVEDPDGGVAIITWRWERWSGDGDSWEVIDRKTTATYMPVDDDNGYYLRATATYLDATSDMDNPETAQTDERVQNVTGGNNAAKVPHMGDGVTDPDGNPADPVPDKVFRVTATSQNAVRVARSRPGQPTDPAFEMASYERTVAENAEVGSIVGEPVMVMPEMGITFGYSLEETETNDNNYFMIDSYGQIRVMEVNFPDPLPNGVIGAAPTPDKDDPTLNFEGTNIFRLIVTATDSTADTRKAKARVTVRLRDLNESPYFDKTSRERVAGADGTAITIEYAEARINSVVQLAATEPDGDDLRWEVTGADGSDFEIRDAQDIAGDGKDRVELHFKNQPNFESPKGSDTGNANIYRVIVRATETTAVGDGPNMADELEVTVQVMNSDEPGMVEPKWLRPEVNTPLPATLIDPDGNSGDMPPIAMDTVITTANWQWYRAKNSNPNRNPNVDMLGEAISDWETLVGQGNPTSAIYTPQGKTAAAEGAPATGDAADETWLLLAKAEYTDNQGSDKTAIGITAHTVKPDVHDDQNNSPDFKISETTRTVPEDTDVGDPVGPPVVVLTNEDNDILTYEILTVIGDNAEFVSKDVLSFSINKATGQIMVRQELNFEGHVDDIDGDTNKDDGGYKLVIRATDPSNETTGANNRGEIVVRITATDVNEAPTVSSGMMELSVDELDSSKKDTDVTKYVGLGYTLEGSPPDQSSILDTPTLNLYQRMDVDANDVTSWPEPIAGPDGHLFEYSTPTDNSIARRLHFKSPPDFENPMDTNEDNVYEVTVRVVDTSNAVGTRNVRVTVNNVNEAGKLVLTPEEPHDGMPVTATLTDPDGVEYITDWKWAADGGRVANFALATLVPGATTEMHTGSVGEFLWVMVDYRDGYSMENDPVTAVDERNDDPDTPDATELLHNSDEMLEKGADNAVRKDPERDTQIPPPDPDLIEITMMVKESVPSTGYVGMPIEIGNLDYKVGENTHSRNVIGGPDAATFVLHDTPDKRGQLAAAVVTHFDYEAAKNTYIVEVTDPDAEVAVGPVRVTIMVMDVNEAPTAPHEQRGGLSVTGRANVVFDEIKADNTTPDLMVGTYRGIGAQAGSVTWSLSGPDMGDFSIGRSTGEVTFRAAPNYEMPMDADTDNRYQITVVANDATLPVTVMVVNVDEDGTLTLSASATEALTMAPQVGDTITGAVMDPDGGVTGESWQWARTTTPAMMDSWMDIGAMDAAYTVMDADEGYHLRATAMYDDGEGVGKMASEETMMVMVTNVDEMGSGEDPLVDRYDANDNDMIDKPEVLKAINDYLFGEGDEAISKPEVLRLINLYLFG